MSETRSSYERILTSGTFSAFGNEVLRENRVLMSPVVVWLNKGLLCVPTPTRAHLMKVRV
eukprot:2762329-Pyramimonas_sp.AAC.1